MPTSIREMVAALEEHLVEGTMLAGLVVWFFLRSFRSTLIVATAIPVSLLGSVAVIYFLGYTFNQMTLLACCCSSAWWSTTRSWCSRTSTGTARRSTPTPSPPRARAPTRSSSRWSRRA